MDNHLLMNPQLFDAESQVRSGQQFNSDCLQDIHPPSLATYP
jgi:hypothetical protein